MSTSPARMLILCRHKSSASLQPPPEKVLQQYLEEQLIALLIKGPVAKRLAVGDPDAEESGRQEGLGTGCAAPDAYTVHGLRCYGPRRIRHLLPAVGPPPSRRHGPLAPIPSKPTELLPFLSSKSTPIVSSLLHSHSPLHSLAIALLPRDAFWVRASSTLGSPPGENAMAGLVVRVVHPALVHGGVARLQAAAVGAGWARSGWWRPSSRLRRRLSRTAGPPVAQPPPPSSRTASCYCRWPPTCGI